jgi:hypothetical protein
MTDKILISIKITGVKITNRNNTIMLAIHFAFYKTKTSKILRKKIGVTFCFSPAAKIVDNFHFSSK